MLLRVADTAEDFLAAFALSAMLEQDDLDGHSRRRLIRAALLQCSKRDSADFLVPVLSAIDAALDYNGFTTEVLESVEPLLDHDDSAVRVVALEVLLWQNVSLGVMDRVFSGDLSPDAAAKLSDIGATDHTAYVECLSSYVRKAASSANPAAIRELIAQAADNAHAVQTLRMIMTTLDADMLPLVYTGLIRAGASTDRARLAKAMPSLSLDDQRALVIAASEAHDSDRGLELLLAAAERISELRPAVAIVRTLRGLGTADAGDILGALSTGDADLELLACRAAVDLPVEQVDDEVISALLAQLPYTTVGTDDYVSNPRRRRAIEALTFLIRRTGKHESSAYGTVRAAYLDTTPDVGEWGGERSDLFDLLIASVVN